MPENEPSAALEKRPPAPELDRLARLGTWLAASESEGRDQNTKGAANALRFYYAEQLELPATAVAELTVINGRLFMGSQLLRALAERQGYRVRRTEMTDTSATAQLVIALTGEILGEATYTLEMAQTAGLVRDRSPWKTHPGRMCWARASTNVIRDFAPTVALGIAANEEMAEIVGETIDADAEEIPFAPEVEISHLEDGVEA